MTVASAAPATAITLATAVNPGTGAPATRRIMASSITVTSTAQRLRPPANTAMAAPVATIAAASQISPLRSTCRGSGGGAPDGRR